MRQGHMSLRFIDSHMHDEEKKTEYDRKALLRQGVTTAIAGNCAPARWR